MKNQKEAVYTAVTNVLAEHNINFEDGMNASTLLTKDYRGEVQAIIVEGFNSKTIELEPTKTNIEKLADAKKLSVYTSGLISNWLRKDFRLNGNTKYTPKNPGSRVGQGDEQMTTLRALKKNFAGTDKEAIIEAQIETRRAELAASKTKATKVTDDQVAKLPAELREKLGL